MSPDFQYIEVRQAYAATYAVRYRLDMATICAVAEQESNWNTEAYRYEHEFYTHYVLPIVDAQGIHPEEAVERATSWGLMQVMGQVAREFGYVGDLRLLKNPAVGLEYGCKKLAHCVQHTESIEAALLRYNGGRNQHYPTLVLARVKTYSS